MSLAQRDAARPGPSVALLDAGDHGLDQARALQPPHDAGPRRRASPPDIIRHSASVRAGLATTPSPKKASVPCIQPVRPSDSTSAMSSSIMSAPSGLWPQWCSGRPRAQGLHMLPQARRRREKVGKARMARADEAPDDARHHQARGQVARPFVRPLALLQNEVVEQHTSSPPSSGRTAQSGPTPGGWFSSDEAGLHREPNALTPLTG